MIVPGSNNPLKQTEGSGRTLGEMRAGNVVQMGPRPTEAQLLMALAEMHRQGQFDPRQITEGTGRSAGKIEDDGR